MPAILKFQEYVSKKDNCPEKLKQIQGELFCLENDFYHMPQLLFILRRFTTHQRQLMLKVMFDKMDISVLPILLMIMRLRAPEYFLLAHEILGSRYTEFMLQGKVPFEFFFVTGTYTPETFDMLCTLWQNGISPNRKHYKFGTIIHSIVANEVQDSAIQLLRAMLSKNIQYNFAATDAEGKTLLILACKLRLSRLVKFLVEIAKSNGCDIGLDVVDQYDMSAVQHAAALGCLPAFKLLLEAGANMDGIEKHLSCTRARVASILRSIHVEPNRDYRAPHNWLYFNDAMHSPVMYANSPDEYSRVLISLAPGHVDVLRKAVLEAYEQCKDGDLTLSRYYLHQLYQIINAEFSGSEEEFLAWLISDNPVPKEAKSILDVCVEGQVLVQRCWENHNQASNKRHSLNYMV